MKPTLLLAVVTLALHAPTIQAFEHVASGFALTLSDDFIISADIEQRPDYDLVVGVDTTSGIPATVGNDDHICMAGFQTATANAELSQDEINGFISGGEFARIARASMAPLVTVVRDTSFDLGGVMGIELVATPNIGPDADNVRLVLYILETSRGRTTLNCTATASTLKSALPVFRAIRDGLVPPT